MGIHNSSLCSAPRRDVGACCRRKVHHPTCPTKNLCRHCAELLSLFLWAFCSQEGLSCWLNVLVEVMHLGTCERKQHTSQSQVHWKRNPNRELPKSFMFYFHNLSWSEGNIGEREKLSCETKSWEKLCAPSPFHAFQYGADSVTGFTAARLGLPLAASDYKQQWLIRMGKSAGTVWQGLLWSHFPWWALPLSKGAPGELCWAVLVCAVPDHTAPSLFIDCL